MKSKRSTDRFKITYGLVYKPPNNEGDNTMAFKSISHACAFVMCVTAASAATYYVSPAGNDRNSGTSEERPFRVAQHAVDRMQAGDTLVVLDGVYTGTCSAYT